MRVTLVIDDDVLTAAKAVARRQGRSLGEVISNFARHTLHPPQPPAARNGIPLLPRDGSEAVVTLETVNALRDGGLSPAKAA